ncbi:MAG: hypothetical protein NDJ90_09905 [Oligoflexia bacterium]|nr:hypothetical protein [Oligoflexia bacterium]
MKLRNGGVVLILSTFVLSAILNPAYAEPVRRGPRPTPTATPAPIPTPTPTPTATADPTPSTGPVIVDTSQASRDGRYDGAQAGAREGRERGAQDGAPDGREDGEREGYNRCFRQESERNYDLGYSDGYRTGGNEGDYDGRERGNADGWAQGLADGRADGENRADRDADRDASPIGRARGIEEANASDATERGDGDGTIAGDREARERALAVDYRRGRNDLKDERFAEAIKYQDEFSQRPAAAAGASSAARTSVLSRIFTPLSKLSALVSTLRDGGHDANRRITPGADFRYSNPSRSYPTAEENQAYRDGYRQGYVDGFREEYDNAYRFAYQRGYDNGEERGCREAQRRDYREHYNRGFEIGRRDGYSANYNRAYDLARRNAYDQAFPQASDTAYRDTYPRAYDRHFESARASAYAERVDELYNAAFERARIAKYNEMYPLYAEQEYKRGRKDEAQDFVDRPVRLLAADVTETIENGLMEPGEPLRLRVSLRNFAAGTLNGKDVKLRVEALDASSAVITQGEATLVKNLREKSSTSVTNALEFRMNESAANKARSFRVTALFQGRNVGTIDVDVTAKFMVDVQFAEPMSVKDGLETQVKFRLTNQSLQPTDGSLAIRFIADTAQLEVRGADQLTGGLNPGESREIVYTVIARTAQDSIRIPLAVSVTGGGRRIGLMDETGQAPVVNDYRVTLTGSARELTQAGVVRLTYKVRNTGSRLLYKSLQLNFRFKNTDTPENFVVIGPSTQFLLPLEQGESATFVVPVLVKEANSGATLELELQEDGQTVVIHQASFGNAVN